MLGFKINNENLDLRPNTALEMERNSPFLQFSDNVIGEYSLPFELDLTPKNNRLLGYPGLAQTRINPIGIDASAVDNGIQHSIGKIKIEKPNVNLNRSQDGTASCYYLTGTSYFYKDIENLNMRDVDFGGDRTFTWDNFTRSGTGFWGHIHKVIDSAVGAYDYAFYPVINRDYSWSHASSDLLNNMSFDGTSINFTQMGTSNNDANIIVPFPYLSFILIKIGLQTGWRFQGDILSDADFKKITLENSRAIDWAEYKPGRIIIFGSDVSPKSSITFNLKDHVPQVTVSAFLLALKNRFGWWYDIDKKNKIVTIRELKQTAITGVKDYTRNASPMVQKTILTEKKIYSLKTTTGGGTLSLSGMSYQGTIAGVSNLPAAAEAFYNQVYLVTSENNYYICEQNDTDQNYHWGILDSNTHDLVQDSSTDDITSAALTVGSEKFNTYIDLAPRWDESGYWPGRTDDNNNPNIILLFYHGIRNNKAGQPYPFASHHIYDSTGAQVANWSLAYQGKRTDGTEVGLYDLNWKKLLNTIAVSETLQATLYLTRIEYMNLKFNEMINIANVKMFLTKITEKIPFDGSVLIETVRA